LPSFTPLQELQGCIAAWTTNQDIKVENNFKYVVKTLPENHDLPSFSHLQEV
jgi:hypothetical protein